MDGQIGLIKNGACVCETICKDSVCKGQDGSVCRKDSLGALVVILS